MPDETIRLTSVGMCVSLSCVQKSVYMCAQHASFPDSNQLIKMKSAKERASLGLPAPGERGKRQSCHFKTLRNVLP